MHELHDRGVNHGCSTRNAGDCRHTMHPDNAKVGQREEQS